MRLNPILSEGLNVFEDRSWGRKILAAQGGFIMILALLAYPAESALFYINLKIVPAYFSSLLISAFIASLILELAVFSRLAGRAETVRTWLTYSPMKRSGILLGKLFLPFGFSLILVLPLLPFLIYARQINALAKGVEFVSLLFLFIHLTSYGLFSSLLSIVLGKHPVLHSFILWSTAAFQLLFTYNILPEINPFKALSLLGSGITPGGSILSAPFLLASNALAVLFLLPLFFLFLLPGITGGAGRRKEEQENG